MKILSKKSKNTICCLAALTCAAFSTNAQTTTKPKQLKEDDNINIRVFHQSMSLGDVNMAISAVHYLLASDFVKYAQWQDTLALLYLQHNDFQQAYLLADALVTKFGYTNQRMEVKAMCAKALQQPVDAISAYSQLYSKTHEAVFGLEQLQLEYSIHRLTESLVTANSLLQLTTTDKADKITVAKADGKTTQQVSLKAVVSNIMGLAYNDLKDKTNAAASFEKALKENPEFELAKLNLDAVKAPDDKTKK